jgi:3-Oxoacyl-[acyl-carrier-protein (ACP)] synthase III
VHRGGIAVNTQGVMDSPTPLATKEGRAMAPPRTASVLGLGHYLPAEVLPNERIAERIGVDDEWIVKRTWLTGLAPAAGMIEVGRLDRVLVIGAEVLTRLTKLRRPQDRRPVGRRGRSGRCRQRRRPRRGR